MTWNMCEYIWYNNNNNNNNNTCTLYIYYMLTDTPTGWWIISGSGHGSYNKKEKI